MVYLGNNILDAQTSAAGQYSMPEEEKGRGIKKFLLWIGGILAAIGGACQIAGVTSVILADIVLVFGVVILTGAEVWFSDWIKITGNYKSAIVVAIIFISEVSTVGISYFIASARAQQQATASTKAAPPPSSPLPTTSASTATLPKHESEIKKEEIDEIIKALREMQTPVSPGTAFSVLSEANIVSVPAPSEYVSGYWVGQNTARGYILIPATYLVFVRITNLLNVRTMISRFSMALDPCSANDRIDTRDGLVFRTLDIGDHRSLGVGSDVKFDDNGTGGYMTVLERTKVDLTRAAQMDLPLLDKLLSGHYLDPTETIGGWVIFSSTCGPSKMTVQISDVAGHSFPYTLNISNEQKTGDLMSRTMRVVSIVNLSTAIVDDGYALQNKSIPVRSK